MHAFCLQKTHENFDKNTGALKFKATHSDMISTVAQETISKISSV